MSYLGRTFAPAEHMAQFDLEDFTRQLIAETLFYDEEYEALGNLSLVDERIEQERFVASYSPEDGLFVIEEATNWEDYESGDADEIGYALAVDSKEHGSYDTADDAAEELLNLARKFQLTPSITLLFEEDDAS
ncbi:MAG: hypothetical protein JJ896_05975 [Rhodothermales bacterium]|nr:hypothetical protein [Rhodothermales bacterium]MBO6779180.1 hypothetical protein [Rhodothermales bacterium]